MIRFNEAVIKVNANYISNYFISNEKNLKKYIDDLREHNLDSKIISYLIAKLNKFFKQYNIDFLISKEIIKNTKFPEGIIKAYTLPTKRIKIIINYKFLRNFNKSNKDYTDFVTKLETILEHELIHIQQIIKSNLKIYNYVIDESKIESYYFSKSEIMSHANDSIKEFLLFGLDKEMMFELIKRPYHIGSYNDVVNNFPTFKVYIDYYFDAVKTNNKTIIEGFRKYLKYCYDYINKLTI